MDGTMAGFIIIDLIFLSLVWGIIVQYKKGRLLRVLKKTWAGRAKYRDRDGATFYGTNSVFGRGRKETG